MKGMHVPLRWSNSRTILVDGQRPFHGGCEPCGQLAVSQITLYCQACVLNSDNAWAACARPQNFVFYCSKLLMRQFSAIHATIYFLQNAVLSLFHQGNFRCAPPRRCGMSYWTLSHFLSHSLQSLKFSTKEYASGRTKIFIRNPKTVWALRFFLLKLGYFKEVCFHLVSFFLKKTRTLFSYRSISDMFVKKKQSIPSKHFLLLSCLPVYFYCLGC